jgi:hypothetical protein
MKEVFVQSRRALCTDAGPHGGRGILRVLQSFRLEDQTNQVHYRETQPRRFAYA